MEILENILTSKIWVKGYDGINAMGRKDWVFYYCIENYASKIWTVLFANKHLEKLFVRSELVNIKLEGVIVCESTFFSNTYRLLLEQTGYSAKKWLVQEQISNEGTTPVFIPPTTPPTMSNIFTEVNASDTVLYVCYPPILISDGIKHSENSLVLDALDNTPIGINEKYSFPVEIVSGYCIFSPTKSSKHKDHMPKTSIPFIKVNKNTLEFELNIKTNLPRCRTQCLECIAVLPENRLNPPLSNLFVNH